MNAPRPERLEEAADRVRRELDDLMEEARAIYRELQDVDAEQPPNAQGVHWRSAMRLRELEQQMQLAQCDLVRKNDPRRRAAEQVAADLRGTTPNRKEAA